jgi:hypothetical protein
MKPYFIILMLIANSAWADDSASVMATASATVVSEIGTISQDEDTGAVTTPPDCTSTTDVNGNVTCNY